MSWAAGDDGDAGERGEFRYLFAVVLLRSVGEPLSAGSFFSVDFQGKLVLLSRSKAWASDDPFWGGAGCGLRRSMRRGVGEKWLFLVELRRMNKSSLGGGGGDVRREACVVSLGGGGGDVRRTYDSSLGGGGGDSPRAFISSSFEGGMDLP